MSDTHFGGPADARERVERVLDHVLALDPAPDLLLVTGDVADHGAPEEYDEARAVLGRWTGPKLVGTGNHDVRAEFARGLLGREADGPLDQALDLPAARFLMLDSLASRRRRGSGSTRASSPTSRWPGWTPSCSPTTGRRSSACTTRPSRSASR